MELNIDAEPAGAGFLRTSPELHMKRLLAAGCERIFQMGPCFRKGERGALHHPEYTMLEWYRANADYLDILRDTEDLLASLVPLCQAVAPAWCCSATPYARGSQGRSPSSAGGSECTPHDCAEPGERLFPVEGERPCEPRDRAATHASNAQEVAPRNRPSPAAPQPSTLLVPFLRVSVRDAFVQHAGWDPVADYNGERFERDLVGKVEPALPRDRPVVLMDYPVAAAALSRRKPGQEAVAERWELYIDGVEIANAFSELTDATEQRARFEGWADERRAAGRTVYPLDEDFLAALETGMPPAGGIALGVDRLVMVLAGKRSLDDVIAFREEIGSTGCEPCG